MSSDSKNELKEQIMSKAKDFGFSLVKVTSPDSIPKAKRRLIEFLQNGFHGQMDWLEKRHLWRSNPTDLWPEVQSIIMFTENYTPKKDVLEGLKKQNENEKLYTQNKPWFAQAPGKPRGIRLRSPAYQDLHLRLGCLEQCVR